MRPDIPVRAAGALLAAASAAAVAVPVTASASTAVRTQGSPERERPAPASASAAETPGAVMLSVHTIETRRAADEAMLHLLHVMHVEHLRHEQYLDVLRQERDRERAAAAYAARHRSAAPATAETAPAPRQEPAQAPAPQAPVLTVAAPSYGSPQAYAESVVGAAEFSCLDSLWNAESGWDVSASNPSSGAYGIPQALPGSKMASAGADWQTNPVTQVKWGLEYIDQTYGSACAAWSHEETDGWY